MSESYEVGVTIRPARRDDIDAVARIWRSGWREVHEGHVPDVLVALRTGESFLTRATALQDATTVAVVGGGIAGFVMVDADEVQQLYVDPRRRGTSAATLLLGEAERHIADGYDQAWLAVVAPNLRARRFYERNGWIDDGPFEHEVPGPVGPVSVPAHRYLKRLTG